MVSESSASSQAERGGFVGFEAVNDPRSGTARELVAFL
jgi:hypothetical protein